MKPVDISFTPTAQTGVLVFRRRPRRRRVGLALCLLAVGLAALCLSPPALAQHRHMGGARWHGDIAHFRGHDLRIWRGGHWIRAHHGGRYGWWWLAAGVWYFYPTPVYPYPDPYAPSAVAVLPGPAGSASAATARHRYYCDSAAGDSPYVTTCPEAWRQVLAVPR